MGTYAYIYVYIYYVRGFVRVFTNIHTYTHLDIRREILMVYKSLYARNINTG